MQTQGLQLKGMELTFVIFPAILDKMPWSNLWSVIFFFTLILLGIGD